MGFSSDTPKSFKMNRKSPLASKLKSSISRKLIDFVGNLTDDVLAEYITVLVCNGKDQSQAKDDLEAFLGEKSAEFVTWLWDLLLEYAPQYNLATDFTKDVLVTGSHDSDANKDLKMNKLRETGDHDSGNDKSSLIKYDKFYDRSAAACNHMCSNNVETHEDIHHYPGYSASLNQRNIKKALPQSYKKKLLRELGESSMIQPGKNLRISCMNTSKKAVNVSRKWLPNQLLSVPIREPLSRNMPPSLAEIPSPRQSFAANVYGRSLSSRAIGAESQENDNSRGSVWDRLGKPCENMNVNPSDSNGFDIIKQDENVLDKHTVSILFPNDECKRSTIIEAHRLGKRSGSNFCGEYNELEPFASTMCQLQVANNIRQKRHFGEINTKADTGSASLVGKKSIDGNSNEDSKDLKRLSLTRQASEATPPNLVSGCLPMAAKAESIKNDATLHLKPMQSQVLDLKLKLRQMETEMSKLREKQADTKKDGKSSLLSSFGAFTNPEEDIEARTVLVTNVHYAATREALTLYFTNCGLVSNVAILTDQVTAQPKGSFRCAYITFVSEEAVDKAVELSGTSFFSRTVKVTRKAKAAVVTSGHSQLARKPTEVQRHINRKAVLERPYKLTSSLQWRRESVSSPSEQPSATTNTGEQSVAASAPHTTALSPTRQ